MKEIFFLLQIISFLVLEKLFFLNFQEFNCLGIFIAEVSTIKWRFSDCRGEFRTLQCNIPVNQSVPRFNAFVPNYHKTSEAPIRIRSSKQVFLEILQYSRENNFVGVSFQQSCRPEGLQLIKKRLQHSCFPVYFLLGGCF